MHKYKLKTFRSIEKRIKITSKGKYLRRICSRSHLLEKKSSKLKRKLRKISIVHKSDKYQLKSILPYF
uniref:Large ribosomal subunit protein bL35c n=1 Tax=Platysiphonia delicata TaxID=2006979 RepID=A0A1Z1M1F3_9FLOR|nr:ribosomal protein L35 [Platysiphonia delicata]ARW59603.1 ribosomal protein L35 [Platysiphonia delicata]